MRHHQEQGLRGHPRLHATPQDGLPHGWRAPRNERKLEPRSPPMAKTRRTFTPEFKAQAVRLLADQGKSLAEVARELDLGESLLRAWKQAPAKAGDRAFPGKGNPPARDE